MYYYQSQFSNEDFLAFFGVWFIPLALTFLLPVYVYTIVMEKHERLVEMMKIVSKVDEVLIILLLDGSHYINILDRELHIFLHDLLCCHTRSYYYWGRFFCSFLCGRKVLNNFLNFSLISSKPSQLPSTIFL